ncbi:unnamed protein product, partial [Prorocentrum cordatum]
MAGGGGAGGKRRFSRAPWHRSHKVANESSGRRSRQVFKLPFAMLVMAFAVISPTRDNAGTFCGCGKNESIFYFCKHCGSLKSASKVDPSSPWSAGDSTKPPLTAEEYEQLAMLCEKLGDKAGAMAHRVAAKVLTEPKSVTESTQVQLNKAHQRAKGIERKLVQAVGKYNALEQQLAAQRDVVVQLRAELAEAEKQHKQLVQKLHSPLPQEASVPRMPADILFDEWKLSSFFDIDFGNLVKLDGRDLSSEDQTELDSRAQQLKTGVSSLAKDPSSQAKAKVAAIKK